MEKLRKITTGGLVGVFPGCEPGSCQKFISEA